MHWIIVDLFEAYLHYTIGFM